jgi:hypothetical protein
MGDQLGLKAVRSREMETAQGIGLACEGTPSQDPLETSERIGLLQQNLDRPGLAGSEVDSANSWFGRSRRRREQAFSAIGRVRLDGRRSSRTSHGIDAEGQ